MPAHYCKIHNVVFFKKGKMRNYAHPIGDTGDWCNEEEKEEKQAEETKGKPMEKVTYQRGSPEERNSIESQVAFKGIIELMVGKIIDLKHPLAHTALNYAASKLGNWLSMGDLPDDTILGEELPNDIAREQAKDKVYAQAAQLLKPITAEEVIKDLKLIIDSKKMTNLDIVKTLEANLATGTSISAMVKSLSPEGLAKFAAKVKPLVPSKLVQEAKRLGAEEIEGSE